MLDKTFIKTSSLWIECTNYWCQLLENNFIPFNHHLVLWKMVICKIILRLVFDKFHLKNTISPSYFLTQTLSKLLGQEMKPHVVNFDQINF